MSIHIIHDLRRYTVVAFLVETTLSCEMCEGIEWPNVHTVLTVSVDNKRVGGQLVFRPVGL